MSEWILNFSWEKKNKLAKTEKFGPEKKLQFSEKKIQLCPKSSEWLGPKLFRQKKKYGTFGTSVILTKKFFIFVGTFYRRKNCNFLKEQKVLLWYWKIPIASLFNLNVARTLSRCLDIVGLFKNKNSFYSTKRFSTNKCWQNLFKIRGWYKKI